MNSHKMLKLLAVFLFASKISSLAAFWSSHSIQKSKFHPPFSTSLSSSSSSSLSPVTTISADVSVLSSESSLYKRRVRYSGKYPKRFEEKYKESRGDEEVLERVKAKGGTPAGTHRSIMLEECLERLGLKEKREEKEEEGSSSGWVAVDCTLGFGGHSSAILDLILPFNGSTLVAIDQDSLEIEKTKKRLMEKHAESNISEKTFQVVQSNFRDIGTVLNEKGLVGKVDCILADLGYSSMQIDNPERGFSHKFDGPLDMRMNCNQSIPTAADYLQNVTEKQLAKALKENSDELLAEELARHIVRQRPSRTSILAKCVRDVYSKWAEKEKRKLEKGDIDTALARTMQAIRIEVNDEFGALSALLSAIPSVLKPGGKVVFLTFHSGEDRRVKKAFKSGWKELGVYSSWSRDVVRAGAEERKNNPRSKCAKLRWAVRSESE